MIVFKRGDTRSIDNFGKLAEELNGDGKTYRGKPFTPNLVHSILTRESYVGRHYYNTKDSRTKKLRPRDEWIEVPIPQIISEADFEAVRKLLKSRDPKMAPARSHSSPVLLSGLGKCGNPGCTGTMMLLTGKGGQYRYYACSNVRRKKDRSCGGNNVPMQKVDDAVMNALKKRLLRPARLNTLLAGLIERSEGADARRRQTLGVLRSERTEVDHAIRRVFEMVESGMIEPGDSDLKSRLGTHQKRRAALDEEIRVLDRQIGRKGKRIDEDAIADFSARVREKLDDPGNPALRKDYVKAFVGEVVMTKERIIIRGPVSALTGAVTSSDKDDAPPVRSSMGDWCARRDSNTRPPD
ncbi:recombinase family protein [Alteripontixanthobacter maritimus]|uniref:recombinase family protein n=1 Tax=Alteripontixanthobacter maritimus TaxID=2161824 RepID=UPI0038994023